MRTSPRSSQGMIKPILFVLCVILLLIALNACTPTGMAAAKAQNCWKNPSKVAEIAGNEVLVVKYTGKDIPCTGGTKMTDYYCDPAKGVVSKKRSCSDPQITHDSTYIDVPSKTKKGAVAICEEVDGTVTMYDVAANLPDADYTYSCSGKKIKAKTAASGATGRSGPRLNKDLTIEIVDVDVKGGPPKPKCAPCDNAACPAGTTCHDTGMTGKYCVPTSASCKDGNVVKCNIRFDAGCKDSNNIDLKVECGECKSGKCDDATKTCPSKANKCETCTNNENCNEGLKCNTTSSTGALAKQCIESKLCEGNCGTVETGCSGSKIECGTCPTGQYCYKNSCSTSKDDCQSCEETGGGAECKSGNCALVYPASSTRSSFLCTPKSKESYCSAAGQGWCGKVQVCDGLISCECKTGTYCSNGHCVSSPPPIAGCKSIGYANPRYTTSGSARTCNPVPDGSCSIGSFSARCGPLPDGCGCTIDCPDAATSACISPNTCIYGTLGSSCQAKSCTPKTADEACRSNVNGVDVIWPCGNAADRCGGTVNCGSCAGNGVCVDGRSNPTRCCTPKDENTACASAQYNQAVPPIKRGDNGCGGWYVCP